MRSLISKTPAIGFIMEPPMLRQNEMMLQLGLGRNVSTTALLIIHGNCTFKKRRFTAL